MVEMQNPGREPGRGETVCKCDLLSNSTLNHSAVSRVVRPSLKLLLMFFYNHGVIGFGACQWLFDRLNLRGY